MKCKFEYDSWGFYFTPLIGYSNVPATGRAFWFGWGKWLWTWQLGPYRPSGAP